MNYSVTPNMMISLKKANPKNPLELSKLRKNIKTSMNKLPLKKGSMQKIISSTEARGHYFEPFGVIKDKNSSSLLPSRGGSMK